MAVDESRYGKTPRWRILVLALPPALTMMVVGGYWTLLSWGVLDEQGTSNTLDALGPIVAGFGLALAYVSLRSQR